MATIICGEEFSISKFSLSLFFLMRNLFLKFAQRYSQVSLRRTLGLWFPEDNSHKAFEIKRGRFLDWQKDRFISGVIFLASQRFVR